MQKGDLLNRMREVLHQLVPVGLNIGRPGARTFGVIEHNGLKVRCLSEWPADETFYTRWRAFLAEQPNTHAFHDPLWQQAVVDQFVLKNQFRLLIIERDGNLRGVLPLGFASNGMLETPGRYISDYLEPIFAAGEESDCWGGVLKLLALLWDWSVSALSLANMRADAACRAALPAIASSFGFICEESIVATVSRVQLAPTWDAYLDSLDSHDRKEFRRKVRNAQTKGNATLVACKDRDEVNRALDAAMLDMELGEKESKAKFTHTTLRPFFQRNGAMLFDAGLLQVYKLIVDGKVAASLLQLPGKNGPMGYNTSYDASLKQWSPGVVVFGLAFQLAIERGAKSFEFLRGDEEYKLRMGSKMEPLYRLTLRRK